MLKRMRRLCFLLLMLVLVALAQKQRSKDMEDNEFAEFEDFDDEEEFERVVPVNKEAGADADSEPQHPAGRKSGGGAPPPQQVPEEEEEDEAVIEDEDDEFVNLNDDEEFEGFHADFAPRGSKQDPPDLKIAKVPLQMGQGWESFYLELLLLAGLAVYLLNFIAGKNTNAKLAQAWVTAHRPLLDAQFSVVGDDGSTTEPTNGVLMKETECVYNLWCSGRVCCEGMLVTLKLLKRQDLVSTLARLFTPRHDQIVVKILMEDVMDSFVFCLANRKVINRVHKDTQDLSWYCQEKKQVDKIGLPASFMLLSEIGEVPAALLDQKVTTCLTKFENQLEYLHISDQYCGPKPQNDAPSTMPVVERVLLFCFNVPGEGRATTKDMESMYQLMQLVFYLVDRVRKFRLSKEGKQKSERNRQKVSEIFVKQTHTQRAEAAQARREDKRRAEKEKMMAEEDPDKQRRMEERNLKKDKNKKPKMKMIKMKAM